MKVLKQIPHEQLTDEEIRIKNSGGIITEQTRKKASLILEKFQNFMQNQKNVFEDSVFVYFLILEQRFKKLSNK